MKFDPKYFIGLCKQSGLTLTRIGGLVHYTTNGKPIEGGALFVAAILQHKRKLLKHLPEKGAGIQLDIFDDDK
jgi:hypothetical protein